MSEKTNDKKNIIFMIKRPRPELHGVEETRRFEVVEGISYRKLHRRVRKAFGITTGFDLAFDEHNTTITMTGDHDVRHVTQMSQREFLLSNKGDDHDQPLVWMVVVPSHNLGEHLLMKAMRWVAKGGRVFLISAASVITLVAPLIPLLPAPHVAAIAAIAAAAAAVTTAAAEASGSSQEEEHSSSSLSLIN